MSAIRRFFRRFARRSPAAGRDRRSAGDAASFAAEHSPDVVLRCSRDGIWRYASPSAARLWGAPLRELAKLGGKAGANRLLHPEDQPMIDAAIKAHFTGESDEKRLEFRILRLDGTPVWVETNCRAVADPDTGEVTDIVLTMREIGGQRAREEQLSREASTDALTGLANRRVFDRTLEDAWKSCVERGLDLSLVFIDVDHFKSFNDLNGHLAGDDCLRVIAAEMRARLDLPFDRLARYGGEEFAVVLPLAGAEEAQAIGDRLCRAIRDLRLPHPLNAEHPWVTVSAGVATVAPAKGAQACASDRLTSAADSALYRAKFLGRNRIASVVVLADGAAAAEAEALRRSA